MERSKRLEHLLTALEQVIQLLEQSDVDTNMSVLKSSYAEAKHLLQAGAAISAEALQELSTKVRSAIHPGMMEREGDVARIALGFNMLSRVA
ncbi:MAG: hypothetical protein R3208_03610 [Ketobacteraceae bacterium]|nr:hypothetical protein [Ketobacteraceae bacterium]